MLLVSGKTAHMAECADEIDCMSTFNLLCMNLFDH